MIDLEAIAKDAAERVHKNGGCVPQLAFAPILFALQDAMSAPPQHLEQTMTDTMAGEVRVYGDERDDLLAALREKCPNLYALPECPPEDLLKAGEDSRADDAIQLAFDRAKALAAQPSAGAQGEATASDLLRWIETHPHPASWLATAKDIREIVERLGPRHIATPAQPDTGDVAALREAVMAVIDANKYEAWTVDRCGQMADAILAKFATIAAHTEVQ